MCIRRLQDFDLTGSCIIDPSSTTAEETGAMFRPLIVPFQILFLSLALAAPLSWAATSGDDCPASGEYGFLCGLDSAEDLVLVPGTRFIIASGFGTSASLYLIDSEAKRHDVLYPTATVQVQHDPEIYGACPGAPDPEKLVAHGLNLKSGVNGHSTLYVVGHGGREAIEVFDVDATGDAPTLTWTGCVLTPQGMAANSVASFADGSLVATIPLHPEKTITHAMAGELTGAVYAWSPGEPAFSRIEGTELPYPNGIEVSADGREFFVASSGLYTVTAYSNSNPARRLRTSRPMAIVPDNLHMGSGNRLLTAGLIADDDTCGDVGSEVFSLEEFADCPRPFVVYAIDAASLQLEDIARGDANPEFSNITMALEVADELWIGTFAGDRIAYRLMK